MTFTRILSLMTRDREILPQPEIQLLAEEVVARILLLASCTLSGLCGGGAYSSPKSESDSEVGGFQEYLEALEPPQKS